jgi:hypothetical protein
VSRAQGVGTPPEKIYGDSSIKQRQQGVLAFNIKQSKVNERANPPRGKLDIAL